MESFFQKLRVSYVKGLGIVGVDTVINGLFIQNE